jgi:hypothetical protein
VRIEKTDTLEVVCLPRIGNTPPHVEIRQPKLGYLVYFPLDELGRLRKALKRKEHCRCSRMPKRPPRNRSGVRRAGRNMTRHDERSKHERATHTVLGSISHRHIVGFWIGAIMVALACQCVRP